MAWVNNGSARNMTLIVGKSQGGSEIIGYPKSYSILASFSDPLSGGGKSFPVLTELEYMRLSDTAFQERLAAFSRYIKQQESGIENDVPDVTAGCFIETSLKCSLNSGIAEG